MPPRRVVSRHRRGSGADSKGSGSELEAVQGEDMPLRQKHSRQNSDASHGSGSSRATEDKAKGEDRQEEGKQDEERKAGGGIHRVRRTSRVASETGSERSMTETHGGGGGDAPPSTSRHTPSIPKSIATASPGRQTVRIYTGDATRKLEASRPPKGQAIPTGTYAVGPGIAPRGRQYPHFCVPAKGFLPHSVCLLLSVPPSLLCPLICPISGALKICVSPPAVP